MIERHDPTFVSVTGFFGSLYQHFRSFFDPGIEGTPYIGELPEAKITHKPSRFLVRKRMMLR
ncbi:hypothetical protein COT62_01785 [Candidatus Roizmanbacteria bacterium CG09_land_8_20_14_0_10_41_9]|uniref:Uncharacterized protein n=1 Tax=Candidatus Roizmanbacteria bacterium CG09_land_8_20_14_0_10_41_9 TaxID=1974850 RepID=A0A2H0WT67_9BACT|nr:MAG: hypothetical protein COT62_01785 [Candidatus Roizmanbacteria bacterium CG09_land_8_20_14_0_10_41_9]